MVMCAPVSVSPALHLMARRGRQHLVTSQPQGRLYNVGEEYKPRPNVLLSCKELLIFFASYFCCCQMIEAGSVRSVLMCNGEHGAH